MCQNLANFSQDAGSSKNAQINSENGGNYYSFFIRELEQIVFINAYI